MDIFIEKATNLVRSGSKMTASSIQKIEEKFKIEIEGCSSREELLRVKGSFLGKQGEITALLAQIKDMPKEERGSFGKDVNVLKGKATKLLNEAMEKFEEAQAQKNKPDLSLPGTGRQMGNLHPITQTIEEISSIFKKLGFAVETGPEIETEFYNFEALNIPAHHPARDMQDTFFIDQGHVLRTQTSGIQIRTMENQEPPIRIVAPGRVFRHDRDTTHSPVFHQIEGLMVDEEINFKHLKYILRLVMQELFGAKREVRFRPSFFPFTEPSAEMDVWSPEKNCWLEVLGCGMVDPNVFDAVGIDHNRYSGWAFGIGIERMAMLKYGINDIRLFYENDLRFLRQFV